MILKRHKLIVFHEIINIILFYIDHVSINFPFRHLYNLYIHIYIYKIVYIYICMYIYIYSNLSLKESKSHERTLL